jgi:hypothetical protein
LAGKVDPWYIEGTKKSLLFVNGWWYFHFTKERFLFVYFLNEKGMPLGQFRPFGTAPFMMVNVSLEFLLTQTLP